VKKSHPRHNKEDKHKPIRRSRSIGENASPRPQETGKPVKSLENAAAKHQSTKLAKASSKPAIKPTGEKRRGIKPKKYDGLACVETFLVKFNAYARYNNWQPADKAAHLMNCLTGPAALLLWDSEDATFDQLSEKLRRRYGSREQQEKFRVELRYCRRRNGESLQELAQDIERLTALAYPAVDRTLLDTLGCDAFIYALDNPALEFKIRKKEPGSLNAALTLSMKLEVLHKAREMQKESAKQKYVRAA